MVVWINNSWQWLTLFSVENRVFILIAIFSLLIIVIGIILKIIQSIKLLIDKKVVASIKQDKKISLILKTVDLIDNRIVELVPEVEKKPLTKNRIDNIFNLRNYLLFLVSKVIPIIKPRDIISTLMDENGIGLSSIITDEKYKELNAKLKKQLYLCDIKINNAVYNHLKLWYDTNNLLMYIHRYKVVYKSRINLLSRNRINKMNKIYNQQGYGNMLMILAIKLGGYIQ